MAEVYLGERQLRWFDAGKLRAAGLEP